MTEIRESDRKSYLKHFKAREIYENTMNIPFPYKNKHFDFWIDLVTKQTKQNGRPVNFAIRNPDGELVGSIDLPGITIGESHKAELGYWLAKPYWGRGIMSEAAKKICALGFKEFGLVRIEAYIYAFNKGSQRVLEKAGLVKEGYFKSFYKKDGKLLDAKLFAKVKKSRST